MNKSAILTLFLILLSSSALRAADVKVTFVTPSIVRVQWSPDGQLPGNATGVCIYSPHQVAVRQTRENGCRVLRSSVLKVSVNLKTTAITFTDRKPDVCCWKRHSAGLSPSYRHVPSMTTARHTPSRLPTDR